MSRYGFMALFPLRPFDIFSSMEKSGFVPSPVIAFIMTARVPQIDYRGNVETKFQFSTFLASLVLYGAAGAFAVGVVPVSYYKDFRIVEAQHRWRASLTDEEKEFLFKNSK